MILYDCFLFNNEVDLLKIRVELLGEIVDYFVIVQSKRTFTNLKTEIKYPENDDLLARYSHKIRLITLDELEGSNAWEREYYSRGAFKTGLVDAKAKDLIMVSDVDEIPRPQVLKKIKETGLNDAVSLYLEYFNFKFNYKMFHGVDALWAGPVIQPFFKFSGGQNARTLRWYDGPPNPARIILNAGWHFSFLTDAGSLENKLKSYSHQDPEIQVRNNNAHDLILQREGFYDHRLPGNIWGVVAITEYDCLELSKLVQKYPQYIIESPADNLLVLSNSISLVMRHMILNEKHKLIHIFKTKELILEVVHRLNLKLINFLNSIKIINIK